MTFLTKKSSGKRLSWSDDSVVAINISLELRSSARFSYYNGMNQKIIFLTWMEPKKLGPVLSKSSLRNCGRKWE